MSCLTLILLLLYAHSAYPLFFILGEKETRCFFTEHDDEAMLKFQYNATMGKSDRFGLIVTVLGPKKEIMLAKEYASRATVNFGTNDPGEYGVCVGTNSTKWAMYATGKIQVHFRLSVESIQEHYPDDDNYEEEEEESSPPPPRRANNPQVPRKGAPGEDNRNRDQAGDERREEKEEGDPDNPDSNEENQEETTLDVLENRIHDVQRTVNFITKMQAGQRAVEERFRQVAEVTNSRVVMWAIIQLLLLLATGWWQMHSLKKFFIAKKLV